MIIGGSLKDHWKNSGLCNKISGRFFITKEEHQMASNGIVRSSNELDLNAMPGVIEHASEVVQ